MPLYSAQQEGVQGYTYPLFHKLSQSPSYQNWASAFTWSWKQGFWVPVYLGRLFSGGFSLPAEWPVSPERCTSDQRCTSVQGCPENGHATQVAGTLAGPPMPMLAGIPYLGRSSGLVRFSFCTFSILTGPLSSCGCGGLGRRLGTKPASLCVVAMVLECSFPDLAFLWRMMFHKTLNLSFSSMSLFGRKWWSWKDCVEDLLLSFHAGSHPFGLGAWLDPGSDAWRQHVSLVSAHFWFCDLPCCTGGRRHVPSQDLSPCSADWSTAACQKS